MARMFPPDRPRGGRNIRSDSDAEAAIYYALQKRLGMGPDGQDTGEYIIFQGVKWFSTNPNGGHQPFREMDFLIVSRRYGLLIVEAKAAKISLQGRGGSHLNTISDAYFGQAKTLEDEIDCINEELQHLYESLHISSITRVRETRLSV